MTLDKLNDCGGSAMYFSTVGGVKVETSIGSFLRWSKPTRRVININVSEKKYCCI